MLIKDLPNDRGLQDLVLYYAKTLPQYCTFKKDISNEECLKNMTLNDVFEWKLPPEGFQFWSDINSGKFDTYERLYGVNKDTPVGTPVILVQEYLSLIIGKTYHILINNFNDDYVEVDNSNRLHPYRYCLRKLFSYEKASTVVKEEEKKVEYVECIKGSGAMQSTVGKIYKVESYDSSKKKLKIIGHTILYIDFINPSSSNSTNFKISTKEAYDKQKLSSRFIKGKWYKNLTAWNFIAKYVEEKDGYFISEKGEYIDNGLFKKSNITGRLCNILSCKDAQECTIEEIQQYLPEGHIDKIKVKEDYKFEVGKWYEITAFSNNTIYYIKYSYTTSEYISASDYIFPANTTVSGGGIFDNVKLIKESVLEEIQKYLPDNHIDKIKEELILGKFKKGDIVVSLTSNIPSRIIGDMFEILLKSTGSNLYYKPSNNNSDVKEWRLATSEEKRAYEKGCKNIFEIKTTIIEEFQVDGYVEFLYNYGTYPKGTIGKVVKDSGNIISVDKKFLKNKNETTCNISKCQLKWLGMDQPFNYSDNVLDDNKNIVVHRFKVGDKIFLPEVKVIGNFNLDFCKMIKSNTDYIVEDIGLYDFKLPDGDLRCITLINAETGYSGYIPECLAQPISELKQVILKEEIDDLDNVEEESYIDKEQFKKDLLQLAKAKFPIGKYNGISATDQIFNEILGNYRFYANNIIVNCGFGYTCLYHAFTKKWATKNKDAVEYGNIVHMELEEDLIFKPIKFNEYMITKPSKLLNSLINYEKTVDVQLITSRKSKLLI